jgi:hypothetical protein
MLGKIVACAALLIIPTLAYADNLAQDAGPFELTVNATGASNRELSAGGFTLNRKRGVFRFAGVGAISPGWRYV